MNIGKVPGEFLDEGIIKQINKGTQPPEVIVKPSIGEDCSILKLHPKDMLVLSTDPITGATENIGQLAVHINANDLASSGGEPIGLLVTLLLPPETTQKQITDIMADIHGECCKLGMAILGGHTEITDAVNKPIVSVTAVGKVHEDKMVASSTAQVGDAVIMTKWAGLEGTAILAYDYEEQLSHLPKEVIDEAKSYTKYLSVVPEGRIAADFGVHAMHDVTEGGILGAAWELASCSDCGININRDAIPVTDITESICRAANVDVYRLISSGSMIITASDGEGLVKALQVKGIKASIIGRITHTKDKNLFIAGEKTKLEEPGTDALYDAFL